ncbi:putative Flp pilus assembly protein, pilin Flp (modular protein) [Vibrio diabolicus]|nr:putative Flp pilus assembly protein, pilin Flp (modular protein) [Vibrio diabolicus]
MRPVSLIARYVKGDNHMDNFRNLIKDFMEDEEGLTLLEYILGAALIVTAFLTSGFWTTLSNKFTSVAGRISSS